MDIVRVLIQCLLTVEGLGAVRKVAAPDPPPSSLALVSELLVRSFAPDEPCRNWFTAGNVVSGCTQLIGLPGMR